MSIGGERITLRAANHKLGDLSPNRTSDAMKKPVVFPTAEGGVEAVAAGGSPKMRKKKYQSILFQPCHAPWIDPEVEGRGRNPRSPPISFPDPSHPDSD